MNRARAASILGVVAIAACAEPPLTPAPLSLTGGRAAIADGSTMYVVIAKDTHLPPNLEASIAVAGGSLVSAMDDIGVASAMSSDPEFVARAQETDGVLAVVPDVALQFTDPNELAIDAPAEDTAPEFEEQSHGVVGGHDQLRPLQWALDAISAPSAWALGALGEGTRVAVIDGGIFSAHPDLAPNLDAAASTSFVPDPANPGHNLPFNTDVGTFWHATHVAGIIAASSAANTVVNSGVVGVAPKATLIGVKVLHNGVGGLSAVINGIYYAATPRPQGAGAHVINLSLGARLTKGGPAVAHLLNALSRATSYAKQQGVTVIASAGNEALDLDHIANTVVVPAQSVGVIAVSATGPIGWAVPDNPFDLDRPASYTNFGQSAITLAAPGGDTVQTEITRNVRCTKRLQPTGTITLACVNFDMVISTSRVGWTFAAGTSAAAPAVAGVAALILGKFGPLSPAQVEARLRRSADDLGKPGNDDFYGRGRVNALRAVQ